MLTAAQLQTFKTALLAETNPIIVAARAPATRDDNAIVAWYNSDAAPAFIVWKNLVSVSDVGKAFVATGLAALTSANNDRLVSFALWNPGGVNPSRSDQRAFFDDVFSAASGASTRAALLVLWKRNATALEKVFAAGVGSDASPATMGYEGAITLDEVSFVLNN